MNFKLFYGIALGMGLGIAIMNLPPAQDVLTAHYRIDYLGLSALLSALYWSHALLLLPGGVLADRLGLNRTLALGLGLIVLGNLGGSVGDSFSWALIFRVVVGMGTGITYAAGIKLAALEAPVGRAGAGQAYFGGSLALGSITSFLLLPWLAALDWRWPFWLPAAVGLGLLPWSLFLPAHRQNTASTQWRGLARVLTSPAPWALGLLHSLSWGSIITLANWMPALIADAFGSANIARFAFVGAAAMAASGISRAAGGFILVKLAPQRAALGSMLVVAGLYLGLFAAPPAALTVLLLLLSVITISANFAAIFQLAYQNSPAPWLGGTLGLINMVASLGGILLTILMGWVKNSSGAFTMAFGVMGLLALGVFWASRFLLGRARAARKA